MIPEYDKTSTVKRARRERERGRGGKSETSFLDTFITSKPKDPIQ